MLRSCPSLQIPVLVSDLDLECRMWLKLRLAPLAPFIGSLSLAFVGPPNIKVQLSPYGKVRLMRIPILQVRAAHAAHAGGALLRRMRRLQSVSRGIIFWRGARGGKGMRQWIPTLIPLYALPLSCKAAA